MIAIGEIAAEYNLNPNMVRNWKREFLDNAESVFENPRKQEREAKRKEKALEKQNTQMLKTIGQEARRDIETLLGSRVHLHLWVKVRENWRNRMDDLRTLGYEDKD